MVKFNEEFHTYYNDETNEFYMGVTTALKKLGLSPDYKTIPKAVLNNAARIGTDLHKEYAKNPLQFTPFFTTKNIYEYLVYNHEYKIASSIDVINKNIFDDIVIYDIKTNAKKELDYWSWQLNIYKWMLDTMNKEEFCRIGGVIWIDKKTHKTEIVPIPTFETEIIIKKLETLKLNNNDAL